MINQNPAWVIVISGELPATVPLDYFQARYATIVTNQTSAAKEQCSRPYQGPNGRAVYPLDHTENIKPTIGAGRYTIKIPEDKFKDGPCRWYLAEIDYSMRGLSGVFPLVYPVVSDSYHLESYTGAREVSRADLWCRQVHNQSYPFVCVSYPVGWVPGAQYANLVPPEQRTEVNTLKVGPDKPNLEVNFHDFDDFAKHASNKE